MGALIQAARQQQIKLYVPGSGLTLRAVYEQLSPEFPPGMSPRSKVEHRTSLKHWEAATGDPDIASVNRQLLIKLRDYLVAQGLLPPTINKVWRTLRSFFRYAAEELHVIPSAPSISYRMRSQLIDEQPTAQRELISPAEIAALWEGCARATYPHRHACLMWRTFLVLIWSFGMRSSDLVNMPRSAVLWNDKLLRFVADKTGKLQGLPITPLVEHHLRRWFEVVEALPIEKRGTRDRAGMLFPDLKTTGHQATKNSGWKAGYYTTWRHEIACEVPRVTWQNFRQLAVTELNDIRAGVGAWCAAHSSGSSLKDVTSVSYDRPTKRIREAFLSRVVPPCFQVPCHEPIDAAGNADCPPEDPRHDPGAARPGVE